MAKEYIEREAAFHAICCSCADSCVDLPKNNGKCKRGNRYCDEGKALDAIPAADVVPVRHGRWVLNPKLFCVGGDFGHWICSECSSEAVFGDKHFDLARFKFCPNCGARMDGDGE